VILSGKRRNTQDEPICDFQRDSRETNSRNSQRITKNEGMDLVEGSTLSKTKKKKRDRAQGKSRICGSTGHSMSYSPQCV
jgi:hypothetical protein